MYDCFRRASHICLNIKQIWYCPDQFWLVFIRFAIGTLSACGHWMKTMEVAVKVVSCFLSSYSPALHSFMGQHPRKALSKTW